MDIVVNETDRLNTIITEFLEYARPTNAQTDRIELNSLLQETITLLKNSKNFHKNISVLKEIYPQLVLKGDPQRLRQVFWNLLINACEAMPDGGVLRITAAPDLQAEDDSVWCQIVISDTGLGIHDKDLRKIFDPFFTTKAGGTGLGLAIVHRIIDDHRGGITVDSEQGKGTQFKIRLPMIEDAAYPSAATARPSHQDPEGRE
jgi:two-component system sensor histidine kinase PilS (NtrC family)